MQEYIRKDVSKIYCFNYINYILLICVKMETLFFGEWRKHFFKARFYFV